MSPCPDSIRGTQYGNVCGRIVFASWFSPVAADLGMQSLPLAFLLVPSGRCRYKHAISLFALRFVPSGRCRPKHAISLIAFSFSSLGSFLPSQAGDLTLAFSSLTKVVPSLFNDSYDLRFLDGGTEL
jgi:hypothetical protein